MTTLTISLPDSLKAFIEAEVEAKGYGNVSEYVRGLLREAQSREADARLEALLLEGLAQGGSEKLSSAFWTDLRAEAARGVKARARRRKSSC